jgi:hypothetical protein
MRGTRSGRTGRAGRGRGYGSRGGVGRGNSAAVEGGGGPATWKQPAERPDDLLEGEARVGADGYSQWKVVCLKTTGAHRWYRTHPKPFTSKSATAVESVPIASLDDLEDAGDFLDAYERQQSDAKRLVSRGMGSATLTAQERAEAGRGRGSRAAYGRARGARSRARGGGAGRGRGAHAADAAVDTTSSELAASLSSGEAYAVAADLVRAAASTGRRSISAVPRAQPQSAISSASSYAPVTEGAGCTLPAMRGIGVTHANSWEDVGASLFAPVPPSADAGPTSAGASPTLETDQLVAQVGVTPTRGRGRGGGVGRASSRARGRGRAAAPTPVPSCDHDQTAVNLGGGMDVELSGSASSATSHNQSRRRPIRSGNVGFNWNSYHDPSNIFLHPHQPLDSVQRRSSASTSAATDPNAMSD